MLVHLRARVTLVVLLAMVTATAQGVSASGAPTPVPSSPSPAPSKAQKMAVEQSRADSTKHALGLDSGEKLVVKDVITDPDGTTHVRYNRTYAGLRVIGGDFVSHRARSGKIKGVNWNGSPEVVVASTKPKLSLSSAQAAGSRKASLVQKTTAATKGELVVYSGGASSKAKPQLAYDVLTTGVRADQTPSRVHTIVDASTGVTLSSWDEIERGTGNGIYSGRVTIGTTAGPPWTMRDAAGNYVTDLNGATSTAAGTTFNDADDSWGNGAVTDRASAGVDAQYGAEKTFDYFKNIQGRNGIWNTGAGARSRVHYGTNYVNAFWDGTQMTYGDGAGNTHPLVELDVAGHEMTHGVTENTAGLVGTGEAGGLNEATSDIFGTSVEWYAANAADNPDYFIGELININGDGSPLRYMDRPSRDGVSPDCWSPTLGTLDVHYSAGPLDHWFYLASEGSGAKTVNGVSYNSPTCNASTVTPIGRDVAARIWYRTLTTYLTSSNSYDAAREGAIQSAKDLYGAGSAQCLGVAAAFSAIAVPAGAQTCAVASPPPPGSNLLSNPGFESGDTLWSSTADVIAQWGGSGQPAHTGTWSTWLGGVGSAHDDSISQLVTIPASSSATLSYDVHVDTFEAAGSTVYDTMTVRVGSTALQTLSNVDAADGYVPKTVNLSAYAGQTISLSFSGAEDASAATSFVLDDLSLTTTPYLAVAPGAPTAVTGTPGNSQAAVSWTVPASNGGPPITGYSVRVVNLATSVQVGTLRAAAAGAVSLTVAGLTNGTAYTFQVLATNAVGPGPYSVMSNSVTPVAPVVTVPVTRLSDFNRDGFADLIARDGAGLLWLYPGDGAGSFKARYQMGGGWNIMTALITPGDVNGDGIADVLARDAAGALWLYPGNGAGGLGARRQIGAGWQSLTVTNAGDMTGDGRGDVLARDSSGNLWVYPLAGNAVFQTRRLNSSGWGSATAIRGPGDFSGDGRADILGRDGGGILMLYRGNGTGGLIGGVAARTAVSAGWTGMTALVTPGNWDRAGGNDLIARDAAGALWLYPGNNAGGLATRRAIGSGWNGMTYLG
ncbi:MAG: M4 family metallopeptidase [Dermatophilaceae bacterium]|nr:M4 family metallopeptidase [Dermatophilaceae bacterium]